MMIRQLFVGLACAGTLAAQAAEYKRITAKLDSKTLQRHFAAIGHRIQ
jgi:hypothetical protein